MIYRQVKIRDNNIYISSGLFKKEIKITHVFKFSESQPSIRVFEGESLKREFVIETLKSNSDLTGQYLHSTVRVLKNSAVIIDGIISKSKEIYPDWNAKDYEAIRFQPFYLSDRQSENDMLKGTGLFQRGLHFSGVITPACVRVICICDNCEKSFTLQHFHAGFSENQYFYSSDSKQTLVINYGQIENMPVQLQETINDLDLQLIEDQLPTPTSGAGIYRYYNSLRCPHCNSVFIDFERNKETRPKEYYGNHFINQSLQRLT